MASSPNCARTPWPAGCRPRHGRRSRPAPAPRAPASTTGPAQRSAPWRTPAATGSWSGAPRPGAIGRPVRKALVDRVPLTEPIWHVTPRRARTEPPRDSLHRRAHVHRRSAPPLRGREQRRQHRPLLVCDLLSSRHAPTLSARRPETLYQHALGIGLIWLLVSFLALPGGQGFELSGDGFVWPGPELGQSLLGLLTRDVGRGLSPQLQDAVPPTVLVYAAAVVAGIGLAAAAGLCLPLWWGTTRPPGPFCQAARAAGC